MSSLLDSWLLKVQDVSNSIQAKEQQLEAQLDENEDLKIDLTDELRTKAVACKNLNDLRIQHAQLQSRAQLCVGGQHATSHTSRFARPCCLQAFLKYARLLLKFHMCRQGDSTAALTERQQSLATLLGREIEQMQTFKALIEQHLLHTNVQNSTAEASLSEVGELLEVVYHGFYHHCMRPRDMLQVLSKQTAAEAEVSELNHEVLRWDQDTERHAAQCEALRHELSAVSQANTQLARKVDLLHAEDPKTTHAMVVRATMSADA